MISSLTREPNSERFHILLEKLLSSTNFRFPSIVFKRYESEVSELTLVKFVPRTNRQNICGKLSKNRSAYRDRSLFENAKAQVGKVSAFLDATTGVVGNML